MQQKWLSIHLFYSGSLNLFIEKAIKPFIELNQEFIFLWFFIRYMENGQHVRLRLLADKKNVVDLVKKGNFSFGIFFTNFPSERLIENENNFINNAIQIIDYQPETQRYGGKNGILISEQFFNYASETIFDFINTETDYEATLLIGIVMNLYVAQSDFENDSTTLFQSIFNHWLDFNLQHLAIPEAEMIEQFETIYTEQGEMLTEITQSISFQKNEIEGFENWQKYCDETLEKLRQTELTKPIPDILASYIHLNNNRLGISNFDESLMAYLILRSLEAE
jgi:thiopeptide-type bacteriocin biosynthesis protein